MKKEKFYELLGEIDENYIEEAHLSVEKKTRPIWLKWSSIAVCICLIIIGTVAVFEIWDNRDNNPGETNSYETPYATEGTENQPAQPSLYPFDYASILDFEKSLYNEGELYSKLSEYGVKSETLDKFKVFIERLRSQNIIVPYIDGKVIELRNSEGYSNVSLFASELYELPWVFYHPSVSTGENFYIKMTCLPEVFTKTENLMASDIIKELSPNSPNLNNLGEQHEKIYNKQIKLKDREVTALVYEYKTDNRDSIKFIYNDFLVDIRCDQQVWNDNWFSSLSFESFDK